VVQKYLPSFAQLGSASLTWKLPGPNIAIPSEPIRNAGMYRWGLRSGHSFSLGLHTTVFHNKIHAINACIMQNTEKVYKGWNSYIHIYICIYLCMWTKAARGFLKNPLGRQREREREREIKAKKLLKTSITVNWWPPTCILLYSRCERISSKCIICQYTVVS